MSCSHAEDEIADLRERLEFWEANAKRAQQSSDYYKQQLTDAHALLGRIVHQTSERWDCVNLTSYFPTNNLHGRRSISNPSGEKEISK